MVQLMKIGGDRVPKDAYYFSHDSNAKDDPKCVLLIEQLGLEGYGIYWVLIEVLRDQPEYKYPIILVPALARKYNTTTEKMRTVINGYGLFTVDENDFFSFSLIKRMEIYKEKSEKARRSVNSRWEKNKQLPPPIESNTDEIRTYNERITDVIQVKESKVNKSKVKNISSSPYGEGESTLAESLSSNANSQTRLRISSDKGAQDKAGIGSNDTTAAVKSLENDGAQPTGKSEYSKEFDAFWTNYPRKLGKQAAYKAWTIQLKNKYKPEKLIAAARNYSEYCRLLGTDQKFMKHASTFLGPNNPFTEFMGGLPEDISSVTKHKGGDANATDKRNNIQTNDRFRETIGFNE